MTNYMEDYFAYGIFPGLGYLALLAAAVLIYLEHVPPELNSVKDSQGVLDSRFYRH